MAEKRKDPTAEALENTASVAETNAPDSAIDVGENNVTAAGADAKPRQSDDGNSDPGETREERLARVQKEREASFAYAENYREKLKKDKEERPMTPAQRRKKEEKEAALRDVRKEVAIMSVAIAEEVVRKELSTDKGQMELIDRMIEEMS